MSSEKSPYHEAGISARNIAVQPAYKKVKKAPRNPFSAPEAASLGRGHNFRAPETIKVRSQRRRVNTHTEICQRCRLPRFAAELQPCRGRKP